MSILHTYSAAILAGGKSSRFGRDKGLTTFRDGPLVERVIAVFKEMELPAFIVSNDDAYQTFGLPVFADEHKEIGPLGGLHTALKNASTTHCFCAACDMPFLDKRLFEAMIEYSDFEAVVPRYNGRPEPLLGLYKTEALPKIEALIQQGNYRMSEAVEQLTHHWLDIDENTVFYHLNLFANINSHEDWRRLK